MYGRSTLENSSFLASSVNPNTDIHGRGFVARLSGSTTEMMSMWIEMFMGPKAFTYEDDKLTLTFDPKLADWLFKDGEVTFRMLSTCDVTYVNETGKKTYGEDGAKASYIEIDGEKVADGNKLVGQLAEDVRDGRVKAVKVVFE